MTIATRPFRYAVPFAALLGIAGLLGGCATYDGPTVTTQLVGQGTYLVLGRYTSVSDTAGVLKRQMTQRADQQCPGGWEVLATAPNPHAMAGGQIWKIRCTALGAGNVAPAADAGIYVEPPSPAAAATPASTQTPAAPAPAAGNLVQTLAAAAMRAAPDLSARAAQAIARAQLHSLAAAGMTITDAAGHRLPLQ